MSRRGPLRKATEGGGQLPSSLSSGKIPPLSAGGQGVAYAELVEAVRRSEESGGSGADVLLEKYKQIDEALGQRATELIDAAISEASLASKSGGSAGSWLVYWPGGNKSQERVIHAGTWYMGLKDASDGGVVKEIVMVTNRLRKVEDGNEEIITVEPDRVYYDKVGKRPVYYSPLYFKLTEPGSHGTGSHFRMGGSNAGEDSEYEMFIPVNLVRNFPHSNGRLLDGRLVKETGALRLKQPGGNTYTWYSNGEDVPVDPAVLNVTGDAAPFRLAEARLGGSGRAQAVTFLTRPEDATKIRSNPENYLLIMTLPPNKPGPDTYHVVISPY